MKYINKKRGFTIVELIIVIAVIGILAAVLIPTFSSLIRKAQVAADQTLIKNLNTALAMDTTSKHETMTQALEATKANGFDVEKIESRATENKIVWDSLNDCFAYIESGKTAPTYIPDSQPNGKAENYQLWVIVRDGVADENYSSYFAGTELTTDIIAGKGVDVGANEGVNVTYNNADGVNKQDVVIRTNGGLLTINGKSGADGDTVHHYNYADVVNVVSIGTHSYYENGAANFTRVESGHYVANENATISNLHIAGNDVKVEVKNDIGLKVTKETTVTSVNIKVNNQIFNENIEEKTIENVENFAKDLGEKIVAKVGEVRFTSLEEAAANAKNGDTIELTKNIDFTNKYKYGDNCVINLTAKTLDLCGHSITTNNFSVIFDGSNYTIQNGSFICANNDAYALFIGDSENENVVVDNVSCTGGINVYSTKNVVIKESKFTASSGIKYYAVWADEGAKIIIEGGSYTSESVKGKHVFNTADKDASILIKGGTTTVPNGVELATGNVKICGGAYNVDPSAFLLNGYISTESNGIWTVTKE